MTKSDDLPGGDPSDTELERRRLQRAKQLEADRKLYSPSGDPQLLDSYVVYLDALGTKAAMSSLDDSGVADLLDERDRFLGRLYDPDVSAWGRMLSFTDNIVFGSPVREPERGELLQLAMAVCAYQRANTSAGRFLRGGLVRGRLYMDSNFATGPGLVRAVEIEETRAVFPRVMLSRNMLASVEPEAAFLGPANDSPHNVVFLIDEDGETFLNYLATPSGASRPASMVVSELTLWRHRTRLVEALMDEPEPSRVRDKLVWASHLHNWLCEAFGHPKVAVIDGLSPWERRHTRRFEWMFGPPNATRHTHSK